MQARDGKVQNHRGFGYPLVLAALDRIHPGPSFLRKIQWEKPPDPCAAPPALVIVQWLQIAVCALALAYLVWTAIDLDFVRERFGRAGAWAAGGLLVALVLFDPLVTHMNLSVMPDALALAASLAFCASLADLGMRRSRPAIPALILVSAFALASSVRLEKIWILLFTLVGDGRRLGMDGPPRTVAARLAARVGAAGRRSLGDGGLGRGAPAARVSGRSLSLVREVHVPPLPGHLSALERGLRRSPSRRA